MLNFSGAYRVSTQIINARFSWPSGGIKPNRRRQKPGTTENRTSSTAATASTASRTRFSAALCCVRTNSLEDTGCSALRISALSANVKKQSPNRRNPHAVAWDFVLRFIVDLPRTFSEPFPDIISSME